MLLLSSSGPIKIPVGAWYVFPGRVKVSIDILAVLLPYNL